MDLQTIHLLLLNLTTAMLVSSFPERGGIDTNCRNMRRTGMMRPALLAVGVSAISLLSGCATGYQAQGLTGGFSETRLSDDIWQVNFEGNGYTRPRRAHDLALLRSADLTLQSGYRYFVPINNSVQNDVSGIINSPSSSSTTGAFNSFGGFSETTTHWGTTSAVVRKPSSTYTIQMVNESQTGIMSYDARIICDSLGPQYKVVCGQHNR